MKRLFALMPLSVALVLSNGATAQNAATDRKAASDAPAADNSANNAPQRAGSQPTAQDQSNSKADIDLTARIRRSVMDDKSLSMYGKNVKIVTADGRVTLNGVVETAAEKRQIEMKATAVAGAGRVVNELTVAPAK